ncbi:MAG: 30S ribosomal protein S2 [bacterium]|nr:30S ribosomal protein S2 [bacterium]
METADEQKIKQTASLHEELVASGLHFGHKTSKTHPKMRPYIAGIRNTVHVINIEKTAEKLEEALEAIKNMVAEGKKILLVGTKIQLRGLTEETAGACGFSYVSLRWIGGTFTNFSEITKRVAHLKELESQQQSGELVAKYTKKERLEISREIERLLQNFGGLKNMDRLPDAVFILDPVENETAVKEASRVGIPIIAICDTDVDPSPMMYPIPANDDSISSVKYILTKVQEVCHSLNK